VLESRSWYYLSWLRVDSNAPTPEFLIWSLEQRCDLRQIAGFEDPERTERHLRTLRAHCEAEAEGRVFEGICAQPPNGFRVEDGLSLYGGLEAARKACFDCPANTPQLASHSNLAGCFGMVPLLQEEKVHLAIDVAIKELGWQQELASLFPSTSPSWYGLWMHSPLDDRRAMFVKDLLMVANFEWLKEPATNPIAVKDTTGLIVGLEAAHRHKMPFHVRLYVRGEVKGTWWNLVPHCQQCHAPWPESQRGQCQVCGYVGRPASPPKRRARGTRPYWPLERMMGKEKAEEFLARYHEMRAKL
jgi:hypothetical protein